MKILKMSILCAVVFSSTAALAQPDIYVGNLNFWGNNPISIFKEDPLNLTITQGQEKTISINDNIENIYDFFRAPIYTVTGTTEHIVAEHNNITIKPSTPEGDYTLTAGVCSEPAQEPLLPYFPIVTVTIPDDPVLIVPNDPTPITDNTFTPPFFIGGEVEIEDEE